MSNLRSCVDRLKHVSGQRVPELDGSVGSSSASGQGPRLPGAPADGFDSSQVGVQRVDGGARAPLVPQVNHVVV